MTYRTAVFKKNAELLFMSPLILLGKLAGLLFPLKTKHNVFLFFPSADIGGSVKVNADITHCIRGHNPVIIFSKKPRNNQFLHLFEKEGVRMIDLHRYIDNKWFHFVNIFFRGVLATYINRSENPVVLGGEGIYFYKVIPHLKKSVRTVEICHLNSWFNFSQAFVNKISCRIFSTPKIKRDAEEQYRKNGVPGHYLQRLHFIDNKVYIPPYQPTDNEGLNIIFVGRGAPQKRVYLIAAIAERMHRSGSIARFGFVGDVDATLSEKTHPYCTFYGNVKDEQALYDIYQKSDVLLLTSAYEGLPIAIMEMMARGKVIVSTAVDGIPDYITHKENGLLITATEESEIIESGIQLIQSLIDTPELKKSIGLNSYAYAQKHFSGEVFCSAYRELMGL